MSTDVPLHERLLGRSSAIRDTNELVRRLARSNLTVLITGESGTGKDITARMLHRLSPRNGKPFIKVNCPAIPESILESELFGHERGAFTGARTAKPGRFELANGGTIFLDEIAETSISVQGKLLQVLDGEPYMRIGGVTPVHMDVRIIAATNLSLEEAVRDGRMREDMYFRLSDVVIHMPPLRERREDIPLLVDHFNYNYSKKVGREPEPVSKDLLHKMMQQSWPGNVRELAARVKKFVATRSPDVLLQDMDRRGLDGGVQAGGLVEAGPAHPATGTRPARPAPDGNDGVDKARRFVPLKEATRRAVETTERALIEEALRYTLWNRRKAARLLEISYSSLLRRIEAYNIGRDGD